jgi:hypothetical protein
MNFQAMHKQRKIIFIASIIGIISVFLPWRSISGGLFDSGLGEGINGFRGIGILAFLAFLVAAGISLSGSQPQPLNKNTWLGTLAVGAIALLAVIVSMVNISGSDIGFIEFSIGIGCWMALAASIGIAGGAWLLKSPEHNVREGFDSIRKNISSLSNTGAAGTITKTPVSNIEELEKLAKLKDAGHISEEEYQQMKSKLL